MKINWKHLWAEATVLIASGIYFITPSLQAYASLHPGTKAAMIILIILGLGAKPSSVSTAPHITYPQDISPS